VLPCKACRYRVSCTVAILARKRDLACNCVGRPRSALVEQRHTYRTSHMQKWSRFTHTQVSIRPCVLVLRGEAEGTFMTPRTSLSANPSSNAQCSTLRAVIKLYSLTLAYLLVVNAVQAEVLSRNDVAPPPLPLSLAESSKLACRPAGECERCPPHLVGCQSTCRISC
jgi:hypothetical protein